MNDLSTANAWWNGIHHTPLQEVTWIESLLSNHAVSPVSFHRWKLAGQLLNSTSLLSLDKIHGTIVSCLAIYFERMLVGVPLLGYGLSLAFCGTSSNPEILPCKTWFPVYWERSAPLGKVHVEHRCRGLPRMSSIEWGEWWEFWPGSEILPLLATGISAQSRWTKLNTCHGVLHLVYLTNELTRRRAGV